MSAVRKGKFTLSARPNVRVCSLADLGSAGVRPHPLGVLQKNSGSTNFENSEDGRQHDYHYYQFLPRIVRVGGREGMKGLGALRRNQLPQPPPLAKILDPPLSVLQRSSTNNEQARIIAGRTPATTALNVNGP